MKKPDDEEVSFDSDEALESLSSSSEREAYSPHKPQRSLFPEDDSPYEDEYEIGLPRDIRTELVPNDPVSVDMPGTSDTNTTSEEDSLSTPQDIEHDLDEDNDDGEPKLCLTGLESKLESNLSDDSQLYERTVQKQMSVPEAIKKTVENTNFTTKVPFSELTELFSNLTLKALMDLGLTNMTEAQARLIPYMLKGWNVLYQPKPGSGITLAYLLTAVEMMAKEELSPRKCTRVIVIRGSRKQAIDTVDLLRGLLKYYPSITYNLVMGSSSRQPEAERVASGVHILVATPGRLLYHLKNTPEFLCKAKLGCLIIDKTSTYMDPNFEWLLGQIINILPKKHQILIFSDTPGDEIVEDEFYDRKIASFGTLPSCCVCGVVLTRNVFADDKGLFVHVDCMVKSGETEATSKVQESKADDKHSKPSYNQ